MDAKFSPSLRRWRTKSGIVVVEVARVEALDRNGKLAVKIHAYLETGEYHGLIWLKNCMKLEP